MDPTDPTDLDTDHCAKKRPVFFFFLSFSQGVVLS